MDFSPTPANAPAAATSDVPPSASALAEWLALPVAQSLMDAPLLLLVAVLIYNQIFSDSVIITPLAIAALAAIMLLGYWIARLYLLIRQLVKPSWLGRIVSWGTVDALGILVLFALLPPVLAVFVMRFTPIEPFAPVVGLFAVIVIRSSSYAALARSPEQRLEWLRRIFQFGIAAYVVLTSIGLAAPSLFLPVIALFLAFLVSGGVALLLARHLVTVRYLPRAAPAAEAYRRWSWRLMGAGLLLALGAAGLALLTFAGGADLQDRDAPPLHPGPGGQGPSGNAGAPGSTTPFQPPPSSSFPGSGFPWLLLLAILGAALLVALVISLIRARQRYQPASPRRRPARRHRASGQEHVVPPLEENGDSIRAVYRQLLQATAEAGAAVARREAETPAEYRARLQTLLAADTPETPGDLPVDTTPAMLDDLTGAYIRERYGDEPTEAPRRSAIRAGLDGLIARLVRIK